MSAKYIKQEISDLNGTGHTQAYYKMKLRPLTNEQFISICAIVFAGVGKNNRTLASEI